MRRSTRSRSSVPQLPPPQVHAFAGWGGQVNLTDPAASDPTMLWDLVNLRLDTGVVAVRPGLTAEFGFASVGPALGMGLLRFPPTNTTPESRQIVVHGTRNEYQEDGSQTLRGALYVYAGDGTGAHDITPELDTDLTSALDGTSNPAFFAQFNGHLYGVNGTDGLFRWDGGDPTSTTALMVEPVNVPPAPSSETIVIDTIPAGSPNLTWTAASHVTVATTAMANPILDQSVTTIEPQTSGGASEMVYLDYGAGNATNWLDDEHLSDSLILCVRVDNIGNQTGVFDNGGAYQFGFSVGYEGAGDIADATYSWNVLLTSPGWTFVYLPLADASIHSDYPAPPPGQSVNDAPAINAVRWYGVEIYQSPAVPSNTAPDHAIQFCRPILSGKQGIPGQQQVSNGVYNVFYKVIAEDSLSTVESQATAATETEGQIVQPPSGALSAGMIFPTAPTGKVQVTVTFPTTAPAIDGQNASLPDTLLVYRAVIDPSTDLTPEAKTYYLVQTVTRSQASQENNQFQFYDNLNETDLLASTPLPLAWDVPGIGALAPKYVLAKDTRLVFFKSDTYPNSIWLSNIGVGEQVPQVLFTDGSEPGTGGRIDIGYDDGDEITAVYITNYEFTIFKRNGIWKVRGRLEGTANETWDVIKIFEGYGCIGPRSICNMPTGLLFYSGQAIYELPHGSNTPMELPMSRQIQRTFDAIPTALKSSVALGFHPVYDLVFATIPNADDTMPSQLYVWDRRLWMHIHRRWLPGMWSGRWMNGAVGGMAGVLWYPSMFLWDGDDFYIARGDVPVVDRFKRRERDAVLYTDWEQPIPFSLLTPWVTPAPMQKVRLLQARTQWTYLNEADNVDELLPGDAPPVLSAALTMRTRPHGAIGNTNFNYTVIPLTEYPNGLFLTGQAADANRELPNTLEGTAFQAAIDGTCSGAQRVNLLGIWVKFMLRGEYR